MYYVIYRTAIVAIFAFLLSAIASAGSTPSAAALQSSADPATFGQSVTLTATVSPSAATGAVTFYDGVQLLGAATISGGKATLTTISLAAGIRSLRAFYAGDSVYQASTSTAFPLRVAVLGQAGFRAAVNYGGLSFPRSVATADFNGDGRADLAVVNFDMNKVSVLLGNGDGTFQAAVNYATNQNAIPGPSSVIAADFNGDGRPDLAVVHGANAISSVAILLGNGNGTFQTAVNYSVALNPHSIAVADFNNDGVADIVTDNFQNDSVSVLLGNGNGTLRTPVSYKTGSMPIAVAVGDFNGDGKADIAAANMGGNSISVLLGNGDGTFQAAVNYATGKGPASIAVGDFNGDGRTDVVVTAPGDSNVNVLLGKGDGTFQPAVSYSAAKTLQSVTTGDFNGDGITDLAATDSGANSANVLLGNGDGTFQAPVNYAAGNQPIFVAVGDFNGDGRADLAVANYIGANLSVLLGTPSAGPHIAPGGVVGAGLSTPLVRSLSPNAIASVFGDSFAPAGTARMVGPSDLVNGRLPTVLNGVCVLVNNVAAPLFFLAANQINFQVPQFPPGGNAGVRVATSCGAASEIRSFSEPAGAAAATPEFFYFKLSADGKNPIAALNAVTGAYIGAPDLIPGGAFVPTAPGDILTLFFTGGGITNPAFVPGELPGGIGSVANSVGITIGGTSLGASDVLYIGVAPGFAGLYQLNIRVPAGTPPGNQPMILTIGNSPSPAGYLFVGPS